MLAKGVRSLPEWVEIVAHPVGDSITLGTRTGRAIQESFRCCLPEGVGEGRDVVRYPVTAWSLRWYCNTQGLLPGQIRELLHRFFDAMALKLGISAQNPSGEGLPAPPTTEVFPCEVFGEGPDLGLYLEWAAVHAPTPALFDGGKRSQSTTCRVGKLQVIVFAGP